MISFAAFANELAKIATSEKDLKNNCFFYSASMAALNPELRLFKGQHSGQSPQDTGHFYLQDRSGNIVDPTASQYKSGKLVDLGHEVSVRKNLDFVIGHPLFHTLERSDQKKIRSLYKGAELRRDIVGAKTGPEQYRAMEWFKQPYKAPAQSGYATEENLRRKGKFSPFSVAAEEVSYKPPAALKSKLTALESAGAKAGTKVGPSSRLLKILGKIK